MSRIFPILFLHETYQSSPVYELWPIWVTSRSTCWKLGSAHCFAIFPSIPPDCNESGRKTTNSNKSGVICGLKNFLRASRSTLFRPPPPLRGGQGAFKNPLSALLHIFGLHTAFWNFEFFQKECVVFIMETFRPLFGTPFWVAANTGATHRDQTSTLTPIPHQTPCGSCMHYLTLPQQRG